jgi:hypothetical protein
VSSVNRNNNDDLPVPESPINSNLNVGMRSLSLDVMGKVEKEVTKNFGFSAVVLNFGILKKELLNFN